MGRWTAVSDVDYFEETQRMHIAEPEPAPVVQSPAWWRAEYARIAALEKLLAGIRKERAKMSGRSPA